MKLLSNKDIELIALKIVNDYFNANERANLYQIIERHLKNHGLNQETINETS